MYLIWCKQSIENACEWVFFSSSSSKHSRKFSIHFLYSLSLWLFHRFIQSISIGSLKVKKKTHVALLISKQIFVWFFDCTKLHSHYINIATTSSLKFFSSKQIVNFINFELIFGKQPHILIDYWIPWTATS